MISKGSWTAVQIMTVILTIAAIAGGTAYAASAVSKNNLIEKDNAEEFARLDAGLDWEDISVTQSELERENGKYVYDITFLAGSTQYAYEVSADDGTILAKDIQSQDQPAASEDVSPDTPEPAPDMDQSPVTTAENTPETISQPETDDSTTADIPQAPDTSSDQPSDTTQNQYTGSRSYISVDQARRIALEHAGLTENEVRVTKAMFENDDEDGEEFEIEFYAGNIEYDYEINALTGDILDFSKEIDD